MSELHHHPVHGTVTVERLLPDGRAIVLTADNQAAYVRLDELTLSLEAAA